MFCFFSFISVLLPSSSTHCSLVWAKAWQPQWPGSIPHARRVHRLPIELSTVRTHCLCADSGLPPALVFLCAHRPSSSLEPANLPWLCPAMRCGKAQLEEAPRASCALIPTWRSSLEHDLVLQARWDGANPGTRTSPSCSAWWGDRGHTLAWILRTLEMGQTAGLEPPLGPL